VNPRLDTASALILLALIVTIGYSIGCWIWPFRACRRCHGTGRRRSPSGRAIRLCRPCKGTGLRLRAGRWIYNTIRHLYKEGTR
jgi:DnaJ-class molecular chaperone